MKITDVEVLLINSELDSKGKDGMARPWRPIILKINTDEGIHGYGEVGMAYGVGATAGWGMAKDLAKLVIGMDPMNNEEIWNKMMKKSFWGQGGGTAVFGGMSAIDIALWDIKGKAMGVPVYQLLGGKTNEELRCYASQIQFDWGQKFGHLSEKEEYMEAALRAIADGYDAVKVDLWEIDYDGGMKMINLCGIQPQSVLKMGIERIEAIRKAVGDDVDIIVENHAETDTTSAIQFGKALESYNVMYYEEVNTPLNPKLTKEVKDKINIPLAGGERIYSRWGYIPFIEQRLLDVLQPDLGTCGGISEGKKICDMAHAYDISIQTHVCGSPIAKAAALHLETAIPNFLIHEHHRIQLMPGNVELCEYDYQPINGKYAVPELPGIGQELTKKAYELADKVIIK
jgi:galactonate dehydratase